MIAYPFSGRPDLLRFLLPRQVARQQTREIVERGGGCDGIQATWEARHHPDSNLPT